MNAPKKIWVDTELDVYDYEEQGTQPYIRENIVDELVEALEEIRQYLRCTEAVFAQGRMYLDMTLMPNLAEKAEAALKKLEDV